jgi:hypothetical protein
MRFTHRHYISISDLTRLMMHLTIISRRQRGRVIFINADRL